jgi:hypothetical protein
MCLIRSKRRVLCILDEVIALRGERPQNIWTSGRLVPCDKTISHHQLACAVGRTIQDTATTLTAAIAIDGAKDQLHLGTGCSVEYTTSQCLSLIIRDRAVDQPERPTIVGDTATSISKIPRDRAVDESQRCIWGVYDAATTRIGPISRDRAVDEGELPSHTVEDAATITTAR